MTDSSGPEVERLFGGEIVLARPGEAGLPMATPMDRLKEWGYAFENWLLGLGSDNSRKAYKKAWHELLGFLDKQPWQITRSDIGDWVTALRKKGLSDCSVNLKVAGISSFYRYVCGECEITQADGRKAPLYEANPAGGKSLRRKVNPYGKARSLGDVEVRALLGAIQQNSARGLRDYALILTYLSTGRRNSEIRLLQWGDFEHEDGKTYYRWSGKGKKDQRFRMPEEAWEAITHYLKAARRFSKMAESDYIFVPLSDRATRLLNVDVSTWTRNHPISIREANRLVKKYARLAGLDPKKVHIHVLRHTYAKTHKKVGDDIEKVRDLLGHSNVGTTQIYLGKLEGVEDESWVKVSALWGLDEAAANGRKRTNRKGKG